MFSCLGLIFAEVSSLVVGLFVVLYAGVSEGGFVCGDVGLLWVRYFDVLDLSVVWGFGLNLVLIV